MDPLSIVTGVAGLVCTTLKGIQTISSYGSLYSRSAVTIASMAAQCSCVEFALLQVQETIVNNPQSAYRLRSDSALAKYFSSVFGACQLVFSILNQRLNGLVDAGLGKNGEISTIGKLRQVWNDQEMKDLLRNVESQASAINLLLGALQMRSNAEIHDLLAKRDSRRLLDKISNDAMSLRSAEDTKIRISSGGLQTPSLHSTFDEIEFTFDVELINTATYRKAFQRMTSMNLSQIKASNNEVMETEAVVTGAPLAEEELLIEMGTEKDQRMEELVTDGARKLSLSGPQVTTGYGRFPTLPSTTEFVTQQPHCFQTAEIVSPAGQLYDRAPISTHGNASGGIGSENAVTDMQMNVGAVVLSSCEIDIPTSFDGEKLQRRVRALEQSSYQGFASPPPALPILNDTKSGTSHTIYELDNSCSATLIDVSIPDPLPPEMLITSTNLEDLMGLASESSSQDSLAFLEAQEQLSHESLQYLDFLSQRIGPENLALMTHPQPNLQTFLNYLIKMQEPTLPFLVLPYLTESTNCPVGARVQKMHKISPERGPEIMHNTNKQSMVTATAPGAPGALSPLASYSLEELLHSGSSSKVIKGRKEGSGGGLLAIKIMNRESPSHDLSFGKDRLPAIHLEIATLHDLKHYNIVRVHELIELEMQVVTIMSYVSSLTLLQYIQNRRMGAGTWRFPEPMVWSIFRQLVSGVLYLHDNQTIHHNLTFDNILFDSKQERIVIKDFKLAEIVPCGGTDSLGQVPSNRPKFVNPYFTAPEVLEDSKYSTAFGDVYQRGKVDVYSCGVILFTMINGRMPNGGNLFVTQFGPFHTSEHLNKLKATPTTRTLSVHRGKYETYDLLMRLLDKNVIPRYDIRQTANHAWMQVQPQGHNEGGPKRSFNPWNMEQRPKLDTPRNLIHIINL